jgi:hypothetical protein
MSKPRAVSTSSAAWFTRVPMPLPLIHTGFLGIASFSSSNEKTVAVSNCVSVQPPVPVQIQRPSASSSALALYIASASARLVTRSSRTPCVQQW